jgi:transcriptional regulator with XRE-family HTH domain
VSTLKLDRYRRRLKRLGIRQEDVAAEAGVDRTTVSHWLAARVKSGPIQRACDRLIDRARARARDKDAVAV